MNLIENKSEKIEIFKKINDFDSLMDVLTKRSSNENSTIDEKFFDLSSEKLKCFFSFEKDDFIRFIENAGINMIKKFFALDEKEFKAFSELKNFNLFIYENFLSDQNIDRIFNLSEKRLKFLDAKLKAIENLLWN